MRISDWSSDVCSSDLQQNIRQLLAPHIFEDADGEDDVEAFVGKGNVPRVGDMAKVHGRAGTISFGVEPCERDGLFIDVDCGNRGSHLCGHDRACAIIAATLDKPLPVYFPGLGASKMPESPRA